MDWLQLIGSYAFPIVACVAMGWYVKHLTDSHTESFREMTAAHKEESEKFTEALNRNSLVLQRLCDKLGMEGDQECSE